MRRFLILFAALLTGVTSVHAGKHLTPYEYGKSLSLSLQGGPAYFMGDYSNLLGDNGQGWKAFSPFAEAALGYNLDDARSVRLCGAYSWKTSAMPPQAGFYPYQFSAVHVFADYLVDFYKLGDYYTHFYPVMYIGLGAAGSFGFSDPGDPIQEPSPLNIVPAARLGGILGYDFPGGLGVFTDLALEFFTDRYNGVTDSFPVDFNIRLGFGVVWHLVRR